MHQELGLQEFGGGVELNWTGKKQKTGREDMTEGVGRCVDVLET